MRAAWNYRLSDHNNTLYRGTIILNAIRAARPDEDARETETMLERCRTAAGHVVERLKKLEAAGAVVVAKGIDIAASPYPKHVIELTSTGMAKPGHFHISIEFEACGLVSCAAKWKGEAQDTKIYASMCIGFPMGVNSIPESEAGKRANTVLRFVNRELARAGL